MRQSSGFERYLEFEVHHLIHLATTCAVHYVMECEKSINLVFMKTHCFVTVMVGGAQTDYQAPCGRVLI